MRPRSSKRALLALSLALAAACAPPPKPAGTGLAKFNAALCPALPLDDTSKPADPNLAGVIASLSMVSRTVASVNGVRLSLTFKNTGQKGMTLTLPKAAFNLDGFQLVDHDCRPVSYAKSATAKALGYSDSGPMPLHAGESATLDSALEDLAPGLVLPEGIYAIRLALRLDAAATVVRGRTVYSEWVTFAVVPQAAK